MGSVNKGPTISNSYATGEVTGNQYVGWLVGMDDRYVKISNSYVTGSVTGLGIGRYVGGLLGWDYAGTSDIINPYWDTETTKLTRSVRGGEGKTTVEMKNQATYSGWDFDTVWKIDGNNYPTLR